MGQILCVKKVPFRKSGHIYTTDEYNRLYQENNKGADKYSKFYLQWYNQPHSVPAQAMFVQSRKDLTDSYDKAVSVDNWNTLVSTTLFVSFSIIQTEVTKAIEAMARIHYSNAHNKKIQLEGHAYYLE